MLFQWLLLPGRTRAKQERDQTVQNSVVTLLFGRCCSSGSPLPFDVPNWPLWKWNRSSSTPMVWLSLWIFPRPIRKGRGRRWRFRSARTTPLVRCAPSRNGWRIRAWAWTVDPVSSRRPPWARLGRRPARELDWSHREARLSNRGLQRERICGAQSASRTGNPSRREWRSRAADHAANAASLGDDVAPLHPARFPVSGERCRQSRTIKVFAPSG